VTTTRRPWTADTGDGFYRNPVLFADFDLFRIA